MRVRHRPDGCIIEHSSTAHLKRQSYQQLWDRAGIFATCLHSHGIKDRSIVLLTKSVIDFTASYWACLRLGTTAVPLMSVAEDSLRSSDQAILLSLLDKIDRVLIVSDDYFLPLLERPDLSNYDSIRLSELSSKTDNIPLIQPQPDDLAVLIPTSGTTSTPKLVGITQNALLQRQYSIQKASNLDDYSSMHWFALDGVSGLRISSAQTQEMIYLEPRSLLTNPLILLDLVELYQLAYIPLTSHLAEKIMQFARSSDKRWRLNSLIGIGFGAEPISPKTVTDFQHFLYSMGFCGEIYVAYGMSETGVITSSHFSLGSNERYDEKDAIDLGSPVDGVSLRVVDDKDQIVSENIPGNIQVHAPHKQFSCYVGDQRLTQEVFTTDNWIRTGDIGHISNGKLFVSGRAKDIIIINGKNISLNMIDHQLGDDDLVLVDQLTCCAGKHEGKEQLYIFYVPTDRRPAQVNLASQTIKRRLLETTGVATSQLIPLWPDQIPRTPNGKVRRDKLLSLYQEGQLKCCALSQVGIDLGNKDPSTNSNKDKVIHYWQQVLCQTEMPSLDNDFFASGGSSLASAELITIIELKCGLTIDVSAWLQHPTLGNLINLATSNSYKIDNSDDSSSWPLSNDIFRKQLMHVGAWSGNRKSVDSLVSVHNENGKKPPLAWVFQGDGEFRALAKALGSDQPLYGMRSGHQIMTYDEDNIQAMALAYVRELENLLPQGPLFIGGNCQGAVIAIAVAQHWLRRRRRIPLLILMEWPTMLQNYHEPVLLLFGDKSKVNPINHYKRPEMAWKRAFSDYRVDCIKGHHGQFFSKSKNLKSLVACLKSYMEVHQNSLPNLLPKSAYQWSLSVTTPEDWRPGAGSYIQVRVVNESDMTWPEYNYSGLVVASRWESEDGVVLVQRDGDAYLPQLAPNQEVELQMWLTRPKRKKPVRLVIDLVEEGNCRFGTFKGMKVVTDIT